MKRKKIFKMIAVIGVAVIVIGVGIGLYLFNIPHRNVQAAQTDFNVTSSQIVAEYLAYPEKADQKYLSSDGNSKILEITGPVAMITEDYVGNKVVLIKEDSERAGVSATFTTESNGNAGTLEVGQIVTIKGVIRSGATYNDDLSMYENVIVEESDIVKK